MSIATTPEKKIREFPHLNINEMENYYRNGLVSEEETIAYLCKWNQGPHFTQAVLTDGSIRNFDPEKSGWAYKHLQEKFQLKL